MMMMMKTRKTRNNHRLSATSNLQFKMGRQVYKVKPRKRSRIGRLLEGMLTMQLPAGQLLPPCPLFKTMLSIDDASWLAGCCVILSCSFSAYARSYCKLNWACFCCFCCCFCFEPSSWISCPVIIYLLHLWRANNITTVAVASLTRYRLLQLLEKSKFRPLRFANSSLSCCFICETRG